MNLYMIRHGESHTNLSWPNASDSEEIDSGLTDRGKAQAQASANWLGKNVETPNAIYVSSMKRTLETAEFISEAYGIHSISEDRIREFGNNHADHSPIPPEDLPRGYLNVPGNKLPFTPITDAVANGENITHFRTRIGMFLEEMIEKHPEETILAVAHGGVINAMVDVIFNVGFYRRCDIAIGFTGLTRFRYFPEPKREPWRLYYLGQTTHLDLAGIE